MQNGHLLVYFFGGHPQRTAATVCIIISQYHVFSDLGTIHLRCRQLLVIFDPYPFLRAFCTTIHWQSKLLTLPPPQPPTPLQNAAILKVR